MKYILLMKIESWRNLKSEYVNHLDLFCAMGEGKLWKEVTFELVS